MAEGTRLKTLEEQIRKQETRLQGFIDSTQEALKIMEDKFGSHSAAPIDIYFKYKVLEDATNIYDSNFCFSKMYFCRSTKLGRHNSFVEKLRY